MARARNIKPGFFENETLAEIAPVGRLLFAGLWVIADRAGRLEDRPKRIRAQVLPYDDLDVDAMLDELAERGFILRYEGRDKSRYIQIIAFEKHQQPHHKERESTVPAPDKDGASTGQDPGKHLPRQVQAPTKASRSPSDSRDSRDSRDSQNPPNPPARKLADAPPLGFDDFWQAYPRKVGKATTLKAWRKLNPSQTTADIIIGAIRNQVAQLHFRNAQGDDFIPNPATWLNQGRWDDEIVESKQVRKEREMTAHQQERRKRWEAADRTKRKAR